MLTAKEMSVGAGPFVKAKWWITSVPKFYGSYQDIP